MDIDLALITGIDIPIPECQLILHQPTIKEISMIGEMNYFYGMQCLCVTKDMCMDLPEEEKAKLSHLPTSLDEALDALEKDHDYLTAGGVFPEELIKNFIKSKRAELAEMAKIPTPAEFDKYYNA